jgi:hypothetical protein
MGKQKKQRGLQKLYQENLTAAKEKDDVVKRGL